MVYRLFKVHMFGRNIRSDSFSYIEGLKSTGMSYRTNDMLFRIKKSMKYLEELGYDITLMWNKTHFMWVSKETNETMYWQKRGQFPELCFKTKLH
jgi:hypothetical protein